MDIEVITRCGNLVVKGTAQICSNELLPRAHLYGGIFYGNFLHREYLSKITADVPSRILNNLFEWREFIKLARA